MQSFSTLPVTVCLLYRHFQLFQSLNQSEIRNQPVSATGPGGLSGRTKIVLTKLTGLARQIPETTVAAKAITSNQGKILKCLL